MKWPAAFGWKPKLLSDSTVRRWGALLLFLVALTLYLSTISRGPFPGESAAIARLYGGLSDFAPLSHPLYLLAARLLMLVPGGPAGRLNLFSALCGALAVALLFRRLLEAGSRGGALSPAGQDPEDAVPQEPVSDRGPRPSVAAHIRRQFASAASASSAKPWDPWGLRALAAGVGATFLMVSSPFWYVATRAHYAAFDTLLLLIVTGLFQRYLRTGRPAVALACAFAYGVTTAEFATMILLAPVFAVLLLWAMWRHGRFALPGLDIGVGRMRLGLPALAGLALLAGLFPYLLHAAWLAGTPAAEWRGLPGFAANLVELWRDQYRTIKRCLPPLGWMLPLLTTAGPLLLLGFAVGAARQHRYGVAFGLGALLAALAGGLLFNVPFSPWRVQALLPLMVTPYVIAAAWTGRLFGLFVDVLLFGLMRSDAPAGALAFNLPEMLRRRAAAGLVLAALAAVATAGVMNFRETDGRSARVFNGFAALIAEECRGRSWLITAGPFEDLVALSAAERRQSLQFLNLALGRNEAYLRRLAAQCNDPRQKGLAQAGLDVFIPDWFRRDDSVLRSAVVLDAPELWRAAGRVPAPGRLLYGGAASAAEVVSRPGFALYAGAKDLADLCAAARRLPDRWRPWAAPLVRHAGRVANDRGVMLDDAGRGADARQAYALARKLDPENLSAWINEVSLAWREKQPEAKGLAEELKAHLAGRNAKLDPAALTYFYGYVRQPEALIGMGLQGVLAGRGRESMADFKRAVELRGGAAPNLTLLMAGLLDAEGQTGQSHELLAQVLRDHPDHPAALFEAARQELKAGRYAEAEAFLARLPRQPAEWLVRGDLARTVLQTMRGDTNAPAAVAKLVKAHPANVLVWSFALAYAAQRKDSAGLQEADAALRQLGRRPPEATLVLATVAWQEKRADQARLMLESLVREQPAFKRGWELLLKMDFAEERYDRAEEHVNALLRLDAQDPLANQFLASLQVVRGRPELAEASLRMALTQGTNAPLLNDLAWVLQARGRDEEALAQAEAALRLAPGLAAVEDTRIAILTKLKRFDEARKFLDAALKAHPEHAGLKERRAELDAAGKR